MDYNSASGKTSLSHWCLSFIVRSCLNLIFQVRATYGFLEFVKHIVLHRIVSCENRAESGCYSICELRSIFIEIYFLFNTALQCSADSSQLDIYTSEHQ